MIFKTLSSSLIGIFDGEIADTVKSSSLERNRNKRGVYIGSCPYTSANEGVLWEVRLNGEGYFKVYFVDGGIDDIPFDEPKFNFFKNA